MTALKQRKMDLDTRVEQQFLETTNQKGRHSEIMIIDMFDNMAIDLSGNNCNNEIDGICPNGQTYDVKSSKLYIRGFWIFNIINEDKDDDKEAIEWYYFVTFNEDRTKMLYMWKVPGDIVEDNQFRVAIRMYHGKFNVDNMKEYDILDEFKELYEQYHVKNRSRPIKISFRKYDLKM